MPAKRARPRYNSEYHDDWAWSLAAMGGTNVEIAEGLGIAPTTLQRWIDTHDSFRDAIRKGKGVSDAKVIKSLYQRAVGYDYEEEERTIEYDRDGNVKPVRVKKIRRHSPPNVGAQCFWLKNRQRERWREVPADATVTEAAEQTQFYLPEKSGYTEGE